MWRNKKMLFALGLLTAFALVGAACTAAGAVDADVQAEIDRLQAELEAAREEGSDAVAELEAALAEAQAGAGEAMAEIGEGTCCDVYRIGIFEDPLTTNYWRYLGPDNSVWTSFVINDTSPTLYGLSDQRLDFVPGLATDLPPDPVQEGDFWTITVEMRPDAVWSDGTPITANDVAFTVNTSLDLQLTGNWVSIYDPNLIDRVEAVDDTTVKFYFNESPGLAKWQFGAAQGPILPEHFWGPVVAEAMAFTEGVEAPAGVDCAAEDLAEADQAACDTYAEAFQNARATLYDADATAAPVGGGYTTDKFEPGAFVERTMNPDAYFSGSKVTQYEDGTYVLEMPDGQVQQLYGDATGDVTLELVQGPYAPQVVFSIYGSQDAAFLALADGEIDYVLNPLSLARGLREQAERGEGVVSYTNPDNGVFYLAFNMRKEPYSDPAFRQAVDMVIDKEFVADSVLQGSVIPAYSVVPNGNAFWWNSDVQTPQVGLDREARVNEAVRILKEGGWTWTKEPAWNADTDDVDVGEGLRMPNGQPMPETTILGPGPAYDPQRASFNQWISEWMRELGMPVESELTGFNTILDPVFISADFDMYILGWGLTLYPDYLCDFFHSQWGVLEGGQLVGYNTPGLNDAEYDATCDEFLLETDIAQAQTQAFALQDTLQELRPYIPLFYRQAIDLINTRVNLPYTQVLGGIQDYESLQGEAQILTSQ